MKIAIGSDHAAYDLKTLVSEHLQELGHEVLDLGTHSKERVDYPSYGEAVGRAVASGEAERGIVVCGTGIGIGIAANKVPGIRCATCSEPYSALLSRQHNDSNVLAFGERVVGPGLALMIVDAWLEGEFEGGRHAPRVEMLGHIC